MSKNSSVSEKRAVFRQFAPSDIYEGIVFKGPGSEVPHKVKYCEIQNRLTGIEVLDLFMDLLQEYGHRPAQFYADRLGITRVQLVAVLSVLTGYAFRDFVDKYLLLVATDLLVRTDSPVDAVARRTGFPRASELSQFLQRVHGSAASSLRYEKR